MKKQIDIMPQNHPFKKVLKAIAVVALLLAMQYTVIAQTWTTPFKKGGTSYLSVTLSSTCMVSTTQGWAVGNDGTVITTTDGGVTWTQQTSNTTNNLRSVFLSPLPKAGQLVEMLAVQVM